MTDQSDLDLKYFVDDKTYNCPFCKRRNVAYSIRGQAHFDWSQEKRCSMLLVKCSSCNKTSAHFAYQELANHYDHCGWTMRSFGTKDKPQELDDIIFHSIPSSFFVLDVRIPKVLRELVQEGEGCMKMNFLTGASACVRKAIYEFQLQENATGDDYESKIKSLKAKFSDLDPIYFDILSHIQDMTSEKVHEQSWDKWDSQHLKLFLEALKKIFHDIYVVPNERKKNAGLIRTLREQIQREKDEKALAQSPATREKRLVELEESIRDETT